MREGSIIREDRVGENRCNGKRRRLKNSKGGGLVPSCPGNYITFVSWLEQNAESIWALRWTGTTYIFSLSSPSSPTVLLSKIPGAQVSKIKRLKKSHSNPSGGQNISHVSEKHTRNGDLCFYMASKLCLRMALWYLTTKKERSSRCLEPVPLMSHRHQASHWAPASSP